MRKVSRGIKPFSMFQESRYRLIALRRSFWTIENRPLEVDKYNNNEVNNIKSVPAGNITVKDELHNIYFTAA